ncbi:G-protein coupled receptor moody isoform X2 [Cimex lectularius]|uniref:G-protein coupled receptors family 1 profile domain-containing protein n=1 Tax=Cimex lectularius TaxID=79782 RepID=A0A8I6TJV7_CIMLE|nr:G-protein coupled receptor moody isoform X2 [Cimex lectularius]
MFPRLDGYSQPLLNFAAVTTISIMIVGLLGNLLTIVALLRCPRVRNVAAAFIISLCVADFLFCAVVLPFAASRFITDSWVHGDFLCSLVPLVRYGNVGVSLLCIAMITINRYIMIAHYGWYPKIYKPMWIACMIIFCWALSFGMQVPTLLGIWGKYSYDHNIRTCSITKDIWGRSSKTALFLIGFVIPCLIIVCCYARIFWVVHSSESRMRKHAAESNGKEHKESKTKRNEWRITKMVLAIFLSFLMCYLPITIIKVYDHSVQYPALHVVSYLLLYLSACINPIIYVIMNHQYRQAYKTILLCKRPRLLSVTPGGSSYGGKSKEDSKTMVSQVSIALTPVRCQELPDISDRQL